MGNLKQTTNDNYVKAFISVAEMLEPKAKFNNLVVDIKTDEEGDCIQKHVTLSAKSDDLVIIVTTEENATKGLQLVLKYYHFDTMQLLKKRSYWYYSFNWKGLSVIQ